MEINLTPEQSDFVRQAIDIGRINDPAQAVREAMSLWIERERSRAALIASVDTAEASLVRGEGLAVTKASMESLTWDVIDRCAARIQSEQAAVVR